MKYLASAVRRVISYAALAAVVFAAAVPAKPAASDDQRTVATRAFPVLLICDEKDEALPCRHTRQIYAAAIGPKQFWEVPGAFHTAGLGFQPAEFERRVLDFFANIAAGKRVQ